MSSDNVIISVKNVRKCFYVYSKPHDRLKQFIYPKINRLIGCESKNYYKEFWALKDVSFEVNKGETVGLVGKNGSGKSTLLQIICGTLTPTSGTVETKGRIAALLELGSGFNPEFTGMENVYLNAAILGLTKEETDSKLDAIAAFADIGDFIHQPVKTYSSGMIVRLAFAVQAQVDPDILIVDEALAVGDARFQAKCFDRLRQLKERGTSILLVTHSGEQIVTHCDRAILLDSGKKLYQGIPKVAVNKYVDMLFGKSQTDIKTKEESISASEKAVVETIADEKLSFNSENFIEKNNYNKNEYRWGDKSAIWLDYEVYAGSRLNPTTVYSSEIVKIRASIRFNLNIHNPIIGFAIKTKEGQTVYNTNSHLLENDDTLKHGAAGSHSVVEFSFMNKLGPGDYFISLGIASIGNNNEIIPHDRRYDVIHFLVPSVENFSGITDLDLSFVINSPSGR